MILISVMGTSKYKETSYRFGGHVAAPSPFVVESIQHLFKPDTTYILMTKEADEQHGKALAEKIQFSPINIKLGRNEEELWELFQSVIEVIPEGESLIIDVTHGFRSQPMLLLSISIYLKVIKNVKISHILYGAFDAKDKEGIAPIFDLSPFLDIITWSFATEAFIKRGDATQLSQIITEIHNDAYKTNSPYRPQGLKQIGRVLTAITNSLAVVRPEEALDNIRELTSKVHKASEDSKNLHQAKPFEGLLHKIVDKYAQIYTSIEAPDETSSISSYTKMIQFYLDTGQYQQAITLAREVLVSKMCLLQGKSPEEKEDRYKVERNLGGVNNPLTEPKKEYLEIIKTYANLVDIRNDINHAGMGKVPLPSDKMILQIKKACESVISIIEEKKEENE